MDGMEGWTTFSVHAASSYQRIEHAFGISKHGRAKATFLYGVFVPSHRILVEMSGPGQGVLLCFIKDIY